MGGAFAPVATVNSSHQELPVGCLWFTDALSGAWQGRTGDHVWEKRCSRLDLLGCDPGSGYAARGFNTRKRELAYGSLRLRDDARAASSRSRLWVASLAHLRGCTGSGDPWPDSVEGRDLGWLPGLPSSSKYAFLAVAAARRSACSRTSRNPVSAWVCKRDAVIPRMLRACSSATVE